MKYIRLVVDFELCDRKTSVWKVIGTGEHLVTESEVQGGSCVTELRYASGSMISSVPGIHHQELLTEEGYEILTDEELERLKNQTKYVTLEGTIPVRFDGTMDGLGNFKPVQDEQGDVRITGEFMAFWVDPSDIREIKVVDDPKSSV